MIAETVVADDDSTVSSGEVAYIGVIILLLGGCDQGAAQIFHGLQKWGIFGMSPVNTLQTGLWQDENGGMASG